MTAVRLLRVLLTWVCLVTAAYAIDKYTIGVVMDPGNPTKLDRFLTYAAGNASAFVQFEKLFPNETSQQKANDEVCAFVKDKQPNLIISAANSQIIQSAIKSMSDSSGMPVIQVQTDKFVYSSSGSGTSAMLDVMSPLGVMLSMLGPLFDSLGITGDFAVIHDGTYAMDDKTQQVINGASAKATLAKTYLVKPNKPKDTLAAIKSANIKTILLLTSIKSAQDIVYNAKDYVKANDFTWIVLSTDVQPFTCDACLYADVYWVRPNSPVTNNRRVDQLKKWIKDRHELDDVIVMMNEVYLSFMFDLVLASADYLSSFNSTDGFPSFSCTTQASYAQKLGAEFSSLKMEPSYGKYLFYGPDKVFQDIATSIIRVKMTEDERFVKQVGKWTAKDGISPAFPGVALTADIKVLSTQRVIVAIVEQPPFIEKVNSTVYEAQQYIDEAKTEKINYVQIGNFYFRGYCIDLMIKIKDHMKFDVTYYEVPDGIYGSMNSRSEWNGLIQELIVGNADIALAALSVMAERENYVDFTVPYYDLVGTTILMKKVEAEYDLFKFMTVLEGPVWGCIVGAYFFTSLLLWIFDKFSPYSYTNNKEKYKDDPDKREFTLKECLWFCMTSLTPQGGGEAPKNISGRLVAATWWLFGFIIIASYTANLAAFLTVSRLESPITSLDDLAKQYKIKYAPVQGTSSEVYFRRMSQIEEKFYDIWKAMSLNESMTPQERAQLAVWDYPVSDKYTNIWRHMKETELPTTTAQAIDMVLSSPNATSGFAYIGDATIIKYAELTNCKLTTVGKEFSRKPYAIAVQQGSPLKDLISSAILKLLNQRDLERLKETWWTKNPNKQNCAKPEDESDGISIRNIGGVFVVILVGIGLSIVTLIFEYWYYRDKRNKSDSDGDETSRSNKNRVTTVRDINIAPGKSGSRNGHTNNGYRGRSESPDRY